MTGDEAEAAVGTVVTGHWPDPYVGVEVLQAGVLVGVNGGVAVLDLAQGGWAVCPVGRVDAGSGAGCEVRALNRNGDHSAS